MAETFDADVIIAGAGMAGATLALALKSAGLEPLLIDPVVFDDQLAPTFDGRASVLGTRQHTHDLHVSRVEEGRVVD